MAPLQSNCRACERACPMDIQIPDCEQKGRAFWWMMAMLAGWNAPEPTTSTTSTSTPTSLGSTSPQNPLMTEVLLITAVAGIAIIVVFYYVMKK